MRSVSGVPMISGKNKIGFTPLEMSDIKSTENNILSKTQHQYSVEKGQPGTVASGDLSLTGFTLLELLIVLSIISILATMIVAGLLPAKTRAKVQAVRGDIARIQAALESYYAVYGDYPPTDLSDLYPGASNGVNNGIESVVACLSDQNKGGPFLMGMPDSKYTNLDEDSAAAPPTNWWFGDSQLREIVDSWDSPFIYFHSRDYDNPSKGNQYSFKRSGGDDVAPQQSPNTGAYYSPSTFQLWSTGPDEKNNNGLNDDISNWGK